MAEAPPTGPAPIENTGDEAGSAARRRAVVRAGAASGEPRARSERAALGRAIRDRVPRGSHAAWAPPPDRRDPIALLRAQDATRVPELVPIRYGRMVESPFAFLRGSAAVMAADLAPTPRSGIMVQACGDAHLLNFGVFGTQERNLVFGMNDFDETLPGPWEWDLKRLAASVVVAGRYAGVTEAQAGEAARNAVRAYRVRMAEFAGMGNLELWYSNLRIEAFLPMATPQVRARAEQIIRKARERTNLQVLEKTTELIDGNYRIVESPPLIVRPARAAGQLPLAEVLEEWLNGYRASLANDRRRLLDRYRVVDAVRKVVGVGSVGTRCWVLLLRGEDERDPLFLQVKEAQASVLAPHLSRGRHGYQGRRVVEGQRLIQPAPDIFLGWGRLTTTVGLRVDYYVRQLRDMKGSVSVEPGVTRPDGLLQYAGLCGWALALAHARSGDAAMISGYLGTSDRLDTSLARFAVAYADQTERDHQALLDAERDGRVPVERGA